MNDLPRYLKAMQCGSTSTRRLRARRRARRRTSRDLWSRYEERAAKLARAGATDARLEDFRWRIEELRVSLFAQELKTPYPVSYKRLDKLWSQIRP